MGDQKWAKRCLYLAEHPSFFRQNFPAHISPTPISLSPRTQAQHTSHYHSDTHFRLTGNQNGQQHHAY